MTATAHDGHTTQLEKVEKQKHPGDSPTEAMSSSARSSQDDAQARDRQVQKLRLEDDRQYDSDVGKLIEDKLRGNNGKDEGKDQVQGRDGRYYPGTTRFTLPELDASGKPTGKTLDSDNMSNGELAKLLEKTIADYDKPGSRDGGKAYAEERLKSQLPNDDKTVDDTMREVNKLLRIGQPGGLSTGDFRRLFEGHGDFSAEDKASLERIGGPKAVEALSKARDASEKQGKDLREFQEKMAKEGIFIGGKTKLCCCVNARSKAIGMIHRARTGSAPENASCMTFHLENIL